MSIRSDLLLGCIMGNRWRASSTPAAGSTVSAQSPVPTNYDSRVHVENIWYSINNFAAVGVTVSVQVRSASQAGTVIGSVQHYVPTLGSANAVFPNYQLVTKRGLGVVFTMDTVVSSVTQAINAAGWIEDVSTTSVFDETYIRSLSPKAWFRFNVGNTVSQWTDQSGNANHLLQATVSAQPTIASDGSYVFDGVGQYLKTAGFTLNQPASVYLLLSQLSWTSTDVILDGVAAAAQLVQNSVSPNVAISAGAVTVDNTNLAVGVYGAVAAVFNGASSVVQVSSSTITSNGGTNNPGGISLGAARTAANFANVQVKEVIAFADAHDAPTRGRVLSYLKKVGNLP